MDFYGCYSMVASEDKGSPGECFVELFRAKPQQYLCCSDFWHDAAIRISFLSLQALLLATAHMGRSTNPAASFVLQAASALPTTISR